jgi:PKD repeat protein
MKKIIFLLIVPMFTSFLLETTGNKVMGQTVNTESFDDPTFPPVGWSSNAGFNPRWTRVTAGANPPSVPNSGPGMAQFRAGGGPGSNGAQEALISPVVDYSGASGSIPTVSIWVYREGSSTAGDSVSVLINTTPDVAGSTRIGAVARSRFFVLPTNEPSDGWYQYTFNVPASFDTDTNYVLLNGTSRNGGNIYVDDVQWDEYATPCSSTPAPGNVLSTDTLICDGGGNATLSLSGNFSGVGGINFQWQSGPSATGPWADFGINSSSVSTGTITTPTHFRCYVQCVNAGNADTSSVLFINVSPNPIPTITVTPNQNIDYCVGSTPILLVASGAPMYTWTPNIASNAVGDSALAAPAIPTTYTIIGTDSSGCSNTTSVTVNVDNPIGIQAISSSDTICSGESVNLNVQVFGPPFGLQIEWMPGNLMGANQTVSPTTTTSYSVTVESFFNNCTAYDTVVVEVLSSPVASFGNSINNLTVSFTNTSTGNNLTYLWDFGDSNTDTVQNPTHTYASAGTYTITLTVSDGTCTHTITQTLNVGNVGIEQLSDGSAIHLYPNPARELVTIQFTSPDRSMEMRILNSTGQLVSSKLLSPVNGHLYQHKFDMKNLAEGFYYIQLLSKTENVLMKLVKY